jgi:membrane-associated HD superfamily phosphohydrolase
MRKYVTAIAVLFVAIMAAVVLAKHHKGEFKHKFDMTALTPHTVCKAATVLQTTATKVAEGTCSTAAASTFATPHELKAFARNSAHDFAAEVENLSPEEKHVLRKTLKHMLHVLKKGSMHGSIHGHPEPMPYDAMDLPADAAVMHEEA